jgi:glycosyltransferase involved in cell wall biosynthesis
MPRAATIISHASTTLGGMQRFAFWLNQLAREMGFSVEEFAGTKSFLESSKLLTALVGEPLRFGRLSWQVCHQRARFDLALIHAPSGASTLPGLTVHHVNTFEYAEEAYGKWHLNYWRLLGMSGLYDRLASLGPRVNIAVSYTQADNLKRLGVRVDDVIYNPIDCDVFRPAESAEKVRLRTELSLTPEAKVVIMVGRFDRSKQWDRFLALARGCPEITFLAVGPSLQALGADLPNLRAFCNVPSEQVSRLVRGSDVMIYFVRSDSCGFAPFEGMACGLPLLCSRLGVMRDLDLKEPFFKRMVVERDWRDDAYKLRAMFSSKGLLSELGGLNRDLALRVADVSKIRERYRDHLRRYL